MKHLALVLLFALLFMGAASAQRRFQVGARTGLSATHYTFSRVRIGDASFSPGPGKVGYGAGFVLRLNLARRLDLQSEINYSFINYSFVSQGAATRNVTLRSERFEIPLQLGLRLGPVRFFGGAQFRVADSERSSVPKLLTVKFNHQVGIMGGVGFHIRKFFIDFRISGYPQSHVRDTFISDGAAQRVKIGHDIVYGGSLGFFL